MHEVIQQNYASILAMIFLVIFSLMNSNFEQDTNNKFINMAILNVILIGMEAYQEELSDALYVKETLLTFTHIIRASFPYLFVLMIYTTTTFQEIIISIPSILNTVYLLFNLSRKNLIFVSEKNIVYLPFVVGVFYAIYLIYLTYRKLNQKNYYESILIIISCAICILAAILESTFSYKSILTTSYSLSVIFFYLFYHTNQNNCDVLTGTYIRRRFFIDAKKMKNTLTAVIALDLNNLKKINDNQGHKEGDLALIKLTDIVSKCITKGMRLYRTGGDEFMILCNKCSQEEVKQIVASIRKKMNETEYRCAIGYAMITKDEGLDRACINADVSMYENKKRMKKLDTKMQR